MTNKKGKCNCNCNRNCNGNGNRNRNGNSYGNRNGYAEMVGDGLVVGGRFAAYFEGADEEEDGDG